MMGVSAIGWYSLKQDWDAVFSTGVIVVVTICEEFVKMSVSLQSVNTHLGMLFGPGCLCERFFILAGDRHTTWLLSGGRALCAFVVFCHSKHAEKV